MNQKIVMCPIHGDNETTKNCPNCRDYEMKKQKLEPDDGDNAEKFGFDYEDQEPSFEELGKEWLLENTEYTKEHIKDYQKTMEIMRFAKFLDRRRKK